MDYSPCPVLGGRSPVAPGLHKWASAYQQAEPLLGSEDISLIYSVHGGYVWWLASRAADALPPTSLAAALPGAKGHRGPGVYTDGNTAAVFHDQTLAARFGDEPVFRMAAEQLGIPLVIGGVDTAPQVWHTHTELIQANERRIWRGLHLGAGVVLAVLGGLAWHYAGARAEFQRAEQDALTSQTVKGDVGERVLRLGQVTGLAVSKKKGKDGQAYYYSLANGKERFRLEAAIPEPEARRTLPGTQVTPGEGGVVLVEGGV